MKDELKQSDYYTEITINSLHRLIDAESNKGNSKIYLNHNEYKLGYDTITKLRSKGFRALDLNDSILISW